MKEGVVIKLFHNLDVHLNMDNDLRVHLRKTKVITSSDSLLK